MEQEGDSMSTEMIIADVFNSEMVVMIGLVVLIGATVAYMEYIIRRWSWMPRRRQRRSFGERGL